MSVVMRIVNLWIRSMVAIQKPLHFKVAVHNLELPNNIVIMDKSNLEYVTM